MNARAISFGCNLRSAQAAGRHHGKTLRTIIDPKANRTTSMSSIAKDQHRVLKPLFDAKGEGTVSAPNGRATRCHESAAAKDGLMLRRDGIGLLARVWSVSQRKPSSLRACVLS
jgi:hypothetical protein